MKIVINTTGSQEQKRERQRKKRLEELLLLVPEIISIHSSRFNRLNRNLPDAILWEFPFFWTANFRERDEHDFGKTQRCYCLCLDCFGVFNLYVLLDDLSKDENFRKCESDPVSGDCRVSTKHSGQSKASSVRERLRFYSCFLCFFYWTGLRPKSSGQRCTILGCSLSTSKWTWPDCSTGTQRRCSCTSTPTTPLRITWGVLVVVCWGHAVLSRACPCVLSLLCV